MDSHAIVAVVAAVATAVLTIVGGIILRLRDAKLATNAQAAQIKREAFDQAWSASEDYRKRLEAQLDRYAKAQDDDHEVINLLRKENVDCREETVEMRGVIHGQFKCLKRFHAALVKASLDPGEEPEEPQFRDRPGVDADFLAKQEAQKRVTLHELDEENKRLKPGGGAS